MARIVLKLTDFPQLSGAREGSEYKIVLKGRVNMVGQEMGSPHSVFFDADDAEMSETQKMGHENLMHLLAQQAMSKMNNLKESPDNVLYVKSVHSPTS